MRSTNKFITFIKLKVHKVNKAFALLNFITLQTFNSIDLLAFRASVVGERSICSEAYGGNRCGADRSANAGMSSVLR